MSDPLISNKELEDLMEQLSRMQRDRDRIRLVTVSSENYSFQCEQVKKLVDVQHYGDAKRMTSILLHPKLVDPQNFSSVLNSYKFKEDVDEIKTSLGL